MSIIYKEQSLISDECEMFKDFQYYSKMKINEAVNNANTDQIDKDERISVKSFNEDSIEPTIKILKEDDDLLINKFGKKLMDSIRKIDVDNQAE